MAAISGMFNWCVRKVGALTADNYYDRRDVHLGIRNACVKLAGAALPYVVSNANVSPLVKSGVVLGCIGLSIYQKYAVYRMLPPDSSRLRKIAAHPLVGGLSNFAFGHRAFVWGRRLYALSTLPSVARNSLTKIVACARNLKATPVRSTLAGALHLFNLHTEVTNTVNNFQNDAEDKNEAPEQNVPETPQAVPHSAPNPTPVAVDNRPPLERFTDSALDPKTREGAEALFQIPQDQRCAQANNNAQQTCNFVYTPGRGKGYEMICETAQATKGACASACSFIAGAIKKIYLQIHPDKNLGQEALAQSASVNLNAARETLEKAYNC